MKRIIHIIIAFILTTSFLLGCGTPTNSNGASSSSTPSMDDDVYKYAVTVCKDAAEKVDKQNGNFEPQKILCVYGQGENEGCICYKIEYSDGVSEGENLDGSKNAYALLNPSDNSKSVQIDNSLDDPASPTYTSNAGERLRIRTTWGNEASRENANIIELDVDFIKSNL